MSISDALYKPFNAAVPYCSDELKSLIEDAARLLGGNVVTSDCMEFLCTIDGKPFNPTDPERGDLMKVAMAAELWIDFQFEHVFYDYSADEKSFGFDKGDYQSLALAILCAASSVWKARNENAD